MAAGRIITVIGGVRSGKTSWSEQEAAFLAEKENSRLVYLASGVAFDKEMIERIERHRADRTGRWHTVEQPVGLSAGTKKLHANDVVLWDCLTTWLTNERMHCEPATELEEAAFQTYIHTELSAFIHWAKQNLSTCIIVSNEVLHEPVFKDGMTAHYQKQIGELHQWLVTVSDVAVEMEAGIPLIRKGEWQV
ncbi:cobinamide kinase [Jeotgalibacillus sp. S-D1]|uniref:bifunctional adenosylcobinamide kinase/adenosylcobinamide-phosphate guanylyltransferase n=1 Tax=Jeotgalibacillus sp. S-D1 TaxID=2552189 RepID=UPI00105A1D77|nr:bifunctional adenosylcobinamide kinase/adenosylcobinamide-phosphate guanylyltransferase [Jeotgalibacillus sp. S-D1]TDL32976.1 cobinamide kinase [Jeotgalibacillus sp. S-D1]